MTEVVCALIAAAATVICAAVAADGRKRDKEAAEMDKRMEERAKARAKESRLLLSMINANTRLTVGICDCLKTGHANGNLDTPLEEVKKTQQEYMDFLAGVAIDDLSGGKKA